MKILLCGGGTGGHITPSLAVAHELKHLRNDAWLCYVMERGGAFSSLVENDGVIDEVQTIFAGKFRRYHGESWVKRLLDIRTNLFNIRDFIYFLLGTAQSIWLVLKLKPDIIFIKGGFVGVPVGLAAAICRVPIITHDSDILPGLANRLIARWASVHATGMPVELYNYSSGRTIYTGTPLMADFIPVSDNLKKDYRQKLKINSNQPVIFITGGSQGSQNINQAVATIVPDLLVRYPELLIIHQVGKGNELLYGSVSTKYKKRLQVHSFITNMYIYSGAADLVIARASSTTVAELGMQGKTAIVIPSPFLAAGHQLKNAEYLQTHKAAMVVQETEIERNPKRLLETIEGLLDAPIKARQLANNLSRLVPKNAAQKLAVLIINQVEVISQIEDEIEAR